MAATRILKTALLPYPAGHVFDVINDIEAYPQYMEGCVGATILLARDDLVEARLALSRAGITQSFATRNLLERPTLIRMELLEGPFRSWHGEWQFQALAMDACKVSLDLQFEMDGRLISLAAGKLFEGVAVNLVDALCKRVQHLHGDSLP